MELLHAELNLLPRPLHRFRLRLLPRNHQSSHRREMLREGDRVSNKENIN